MCPAGLAVVDLAGPLTGSRHDNPKAARRHADVLVAIEAARLAVGRRSGPEAEDERGHAWLLRRDVWLS